MKSLLVISLATLILATAMKDMTMFTFFKINQTNIIEKSCINKDKPMAMCYGKCFLEKKIEQTKGAENSTPLAKETSKPSPITLFFETISTIHFQSLEVANKASFVFNQLHSQSFLFTIFGPPRLAA